MFSGSILREALSYFKTKPRRHSLALNLFEMEPQSGEEELLDLDLGLDQMENWVT